MPTVFESIIYERVLITLLFYFNIRSVLLIMQQFKKSAFIHINDQINDNGPSLNTADLELLALVTAFSLRKPCPEFLSCLFTDVLFFFLSRIKCSEKFSELDRIDILKKAEFNL